jgi:hypothetical protein
VKVIKERKYSTNKYYSIFLVIVDAQKDFHTRRNKHHGLERTTITSVVPTQPTSMRQSPAGIVTARASQVATTSSELIDTEELVPEEAEQLEDNIIPHATLRETSQSSIEDTTMMTILDGSIGSSTIIISAPTTASTTTMSTPPTRKNFQLFLVPETV